MIILKKFVKSVSALVTRHFNPRVFDQRGKDVASKGNGKGCGSKHGHGLARGLGGSDSGLERAVQKQAPCHVILKPCQFFLQFVFNDSNIADGNEHYMVE